MQIDSFSRFFSGVVGTGLGFLLTLGSPAEAQILPEAGLTHTITAPPTKDAVERDRLLAMHETVGDNVSPKARAYFIAQRHARAFCAQYWTVLVPVVFTPTAMDLTKFTKKLEGGQPVCSSRRLFIGSYDNTGHQYVEPDLKAALRCATMHALADNMWGSDHFEGYAMLSILYAEGAGVPQSWPVAAHYACLEVPWSMANKARR